MDKHNAVAVLLMHCTSPGYYGISFHMPQFLRSSLERIIAGMPMKFTLVLMRDAFWLYKNSLSIVNFLVCIAHHETNRRVCVRVGSVTFASFTLPVPTGKLGGPCSEDRNPHLNRKSTSVACPARRHFPRSCIFSKYNNGASKMFVCVFVWRGVRWGGGKDIGPHVWIIYSYDVVLVVRSCDFLFLWVGSGGVVGLLVGGLLLRQSMTCSLFVRLVGLHRYWLSQYIQIARKMALSFRTWLVSVAWLMLSSHQVLNSASVCEMWWCWYVCVKYIFNVKTSDRD